jgi:hypothetical protein
MGLLDYEERFGELSQATLAHMQEVATRAGQFSQSLTEITSEVQDIHPDDPATTQKRVRLSSLVARAVDEYASDLQNATSPLMEKWAEMESTLDSLLQRSSVTTPEDVAAARDFIVILEDFTAELGEATGALLKARSSVRTLSSISRELGRAVPRLERALNSMMSAMDAGAAFSNRTKRVLEQRIQEFEGND